MTLFEDLTQLTSYQRKFFDKCKQEYPSENGIIHVTQTSASSLLFTEHGHFKAPHHENKTLNYYQWCLVSPQQLQLSHLRYKEATLLATFALNPTAMVFTSQPFQCAQDSYNARLHYGDGAIILSWQINGPKKDLFIETHYRHASL